MEKFKEEVIEFSVQFGPKILGAILILIVGSWLIKVIVNILGKALDKGKIDVSLRSFLKQALSFILKIILIITAASALGIPMTTFIAILSAVGLAVGLAIKDNLANLAGGIIILIFRPFNVGDFIESEGVSGTVKEISLIYTYINTIDNRRVMFPNGELANSKIINYSAEKDRRLDITFHVSYRENIEKVRAILSDIIEQHPRIFKEPAPAIRVSEHAEYAIVFIVKVWCRNEDYLDISYDLLEKVKSAFDREGIEIPISQKDITIHS